jgi:ribosome-binding protein aMBF1 (putative translation factor)
MITGTQIRVARGLLRWSPQELARRAKISVATIKRSEAAEGEPAITLANAAAIRRALEAGGVSFGEENSVRLG